MTAAASAFRIERATKASRLAAIAGPLLFAALGSLPAWGDNGTMRLLVELFTLLAMAEMWNLLAGYGGLISIGQQAFVGFGAYALFVGLDRLGLAPLLAVAVIAAAVLPLAGFTSVFAFRLSGGYFAIGTWVIAEVLRILVANARELGAGTGVTVQSLVGMAPGPRQALVYWLALIIGFGSVVIAALIMRSRLGLALRAVRDNESAARSLGVDVFRAKLAIYLVAAVVTALAGAVVYMQLLRIQPNAAFGVDWMAKIIFIVVIGGLGRIEGPILGTILFFALRQSLADYGSLYLVILGAVAILMALLAPRGLWGLLTSRFAMAPFGIQRRVVLPMPDEQVHPTRVTTE
jgi:branched-chain amino acid transport system permease protein